MIPPTTPAVRRFAVRVAGLPVDALHELRRPAVRSAVDHLLAERDRLAHEGTRLADACHPVIGALAGSELKPRVVALRRSLHGASVPGPAVWSDQVRQALPPALAERIDAWLAALRAHRADFAALPDRYDRDLPDALSAVRRHTANPAFRHGLVQGNPMLSDALTAWLDSPAGAEPARRTRLRLVKYLARAAAKTSPYATFTVTGLGEWRRCGSAVAPTGATAWRSVVEPNVWVMQRLAHALAGPRTPPRGRVLRVNPTLCEEDGRFWFVAPGWSERVLSVAADGAARACVDLLRAGGPRTAAELRDHLAARAGGSAARSDAVAAVAEVAEVTAATSATTVTETATAYLARLVEVGLLEVALPFADQSPDHLGELLRHLERWELPDGQRQLQAVRRALAAYPGSSAAVRTALHRRVDREITGLLETYGTPGDRTQAPPRKNLFHENAVFTEVVLHGDPQRWAGALADLAAVGRLLALFRPDAALRLVAAEVFADHAGPVPFPLFHRALVTRLRDARPGSAAAELRALLNPATAGGHPPGASPVPAVRELAGLRAEAIGFLRDHPADGDGVVRLPARAVDRLLADLAPHRSAPGPLSCYVQEAGRDDDGDLDLVLNGVGAGHGHGTARLRRVLSELAQEKGGFADRTAEPADGPADRPGGVLFAESGGAFGSNLNLRADGVRFEIDTPGVDSHRPAAERLPAAELFVDHDPDRRRLVLRHGPDGPEVRPLHLGTMADRLLPPLMLLLVRLFGETPGPSAGLWELLTTTPAAHSREVLHRPRTAVGRVVVARASWCVRADAVPRQSRGEHEAHYLLRLTDWARRHGVPERTFVRAVPDRPAPRQPAGGREPQRPGDLGELRDRKPMFLDLANPDLVLLFHRLLTRPDRVLLFQEALPDPAAAPVLGGLGRRVVEYVVEVDPSAEPSADAGADSAVAPGVDPEVAPGADPRTAGAGRG
ncbi:lantibiotic dehydratase [Kitasatospora sp. NPDC056076]|uniref:lantibiotic dehydratase n=1 Tax=Kitasatospora sp. NPDC056076 TaxID=3345703 RepID=UPI0035E26323